MKRHPVLSVLMALIGIVMLVPGGCVILLISTYGWPVSAGSQVTMEFWYILWSICFAISALGVYLIVKACC